MKNLTIIGAGHVGLVTAASLCELNYTVTCLDTDKHKINNLNQGISPFYEPGLDDLLHKSAANGKLYFTADPKLALSQADMIFIAVGTPLGSEGSVDLQYVWQAAETIASNLTAPEVTIVTKSTVPVGTNEKIAEVIRQQLPSDWEFGMVSNPEFLREGSALHDTFHADRIVIGADDEKHAAVLEQLYEPFNLPIVKTDLRSAEMIKYASNTFLAAKLSFINEMANLCEANGANIEDVTHGMGMDARIGSHYFQAGLGYGGSCLPKDTLALLDMGKDAGQPMKMVQAAVSVNNQQPYRLIDKAKNRFGSLQGLHVALLGCSFKPNTSDIRYSPAILLAEHLLDAGATVTAYDPLSLENMREVMGDRIQYRSTIEEAIKDRDFVLIASDWDEIKEFPLSVYRQHMKQPIIFDGRNCYRLEAMESHPIEYHSIGRPVVGI